MPSQQITISYAREMLLEEGFEQVDTVWAADNPGPQQLINYVDDGVAFVNHRGSGWNQGWAGINFYYWTVPQISNPGLLCIVTGIGCGVAKFDAPDGQCFGEQWMLHGSVTTPQGAVGFIGPCWNTHTVYNDNLDTCLYRAILTYNIDNLMPALVAGKMFAWAMFADFQNEDGVQQVATMMMRQYLGLCDPSLKLFTDTPERMPITLPSAIPAGPFSFPVTIADGFTVDTDSLAISFRTETGNQSQFAIPTQAGTWYLPVDFAFDDSVVATIDGHNILTRQIGITVAPSGVYLIHQGLSVSDAGGNNDGRIQPGETVSLRDTVRNIGSDAAFDVEGSLSTSSDNVSITVSQGQYGNVGSNEIVVGAPLYSLTVLPEFRGSNMAIEIAYQAVSVDPRSDQFFLTVYAPELERSNLIVADGDDGFLERLEPAGLVFTITNTGNETLIASALELQTTSGYIIVEDGTAQIPAIAPNQSYTLPEDALRISGAWNAPTGTQVTVNAIVSAQMPTYAFSRSLALPLVLGQVGQADPMTGSDNTYYMYDDLDVDYDRAAVYDWFEISPTLDGPGTTLEFTQSQQTFSVPVPFSYGYFGTSYNSLSISTDGWVAPGNTEATSYDNHALPYSSDLVSGMIAVLWNDLWYFFGDTGDISYYYDAAGDRFIVEWHAVTDWGTGTRPNTFQVQLLNPATHQTPTGDAEWVMLYQSLTMHPTAAQGATIGYETFDELYGATYYHNNVEPPTSAPLENGRAIRLTTAPPTITDSPEVAEIPKTFVLFQNYPNPFNPETTIEYALAARTNVKLEVFDVLGRNVVTLAEGARDAGIHRLQWNGKSNSGISVPSGIYFYRLVTPDIVQTRRMLLMR
ncbi:MAG: T9SS type A sorting domain-containing protein [bacterium]|nr:T9SS type A sorting domain-containing protein [bacterium]